MPPARSPGHCRQSVGHAVPVESYLISSNPLGSRRGRVRPRVCRAVHALSYVCLRICTTSSGSWRRDRVARLEVALRPSLVFASIHPVARLSPRPPYLTTMCRAERFYVRRGHCGQPAARAAAGAALGRASSTSRARRNRQRAPGLDPRWKCVLELTPAHAPPGRQILDARPLSPARRSGPSHSALRRGTCARRLPAEGGGFTRPSWSSSSGDGKRASSAASGPPSWPGDQSSRHDRRAPVSRTRAPAHGFPADHLAPRGHVAADQRVEEASSQGALGGCSVATAPRRRPPAAISSPPRPVWPRPCKPVTTSIAVRFRSRSQELGDRDSHRHASAAPPPATRSPTVRPSVTTPIWSEERVCVPHRVRGHEPAMAAQEVFRSGGAATIAAARAQPAREASAPLSISGREYGAAHLGPDQRGDTFAGARVGLRDQAVCFSPHVVPDALELLAQTSTMSAARRRSAGPRNRESQVDALW